jgi:hypothetical protein
VTDKNGPADEATMKLGLLMESAQAHQKLAEAHLEKLRLHTHGLDGVVRDEIRRTLLDELQTVTAESAAAARALRGVQLAAESRRFAWSLGIAVLCAAVPAAAVHVLLPTEAEIASLRQRRDGLTESIARLERLGGRADWRLCGQPGRLCVRIDRNAPTFGEKADYMVVRGY